jgi:hypothetical protein
MDFSFYPLRFKKSENQERQKADPKSDLFITLHILDGSGYINYYGLSFIMSVILSAFTKMGLLCGSGLPHRFKKE